MHEAQLEEGRNDNVPWDPWYEFRWCAVVAGASICTVGAVVATILMLTLGGR